MTFSEVAKMIEAGFTKDEIMSFINPQNPQENPQDVKSEHSEDVPENSSEKAVPAPGAQAEKSPDPGSAQTENTIIPENTVFNQLNENITKLIKTIQASNLQSAFTEKASEEDMTKQVDKIMQSIIRPDINKGGKA